MDYFAPAQLSLSLRARPHVVVWGQLVVLTSIRQLSIERRPWWSGITLGESYHALQKREVQACPRAEARRATLWCFLWPYAQPQFPTNMHSTREPEMVYFAMYKTRYVPSRH